MPRPTPHAFGCTNTRALGGPGTPGTECPACQPPTDTVFRVFTGKDSDGEPFALFPALPGTNDPATCSSYARLGQHGSADPIGCVRRSRPATEAEYEPLRRELERIGYNVRPVSRCTRAHYAARLEALKPAPRKDRSTFLAQWQADYDRAVKKPGEVLNVYARKGRFGGLAIWVDVRIPSQGDPTGRVVHFSPYLDSSPGDGTHEEDAPACSCDSCAFDSDPDAWLDSMHGITDWGSVDWGTGEDFIPAY